ncbi:MAG: hypothetical protein WBA05_11960 [Gordonia sp. (in: high G+C Gram-positive bacteria)]|uniref:AMIN-like domain-containing (lipo)protein n=1 Tax=Gordonia sp. (in: high G+C Gram-positive bacteria) TaxID=84139 RepID=UPI003C71C9E8
MNRMSTAAAAIGTAAVLVLSGCGSSKEQAPAPSGSAGPGTSTAASAPMSTGVPTSTGGTSTAPASSSKPTSAPNSGRPRLADLRTGVHDNLDRVVLQFAGATPPAFRQERTAAPSHCGSGHPVSMGAPDYQLITVDSVDLFDDAGRPYYTGPTTLPAPRAKGAGGVAGVEIICQFEGVLTVAIGLRDSSAAVHVSTLREPGRIVVDVFH